MDEKLPYMQAYGHIDTVLGKIKAAATPDRFTHDFLSTKLGVKSKAARPFIAFAKRVGLLNQDGSPTDAYKRFRSPDPAVSGRAMAEALRAGYAPLYEVNEYAHNTERPQLEGLIVQVTGLKPSSKMVKATAASFEALKARSNFGGPEPREQEGPEQVDRAAADQVLTTPQAPLEFGLSYQINLVLPKTDDIGVFNAIFKSLKENLLP